jgi:hypothetical protein
MMGTITRTENWVYQLIFNEYLVAIEAEERCGNILTDDNCAEQHFVLVARTVTTTKEVV